MLHIYFKEYKNEQNKFLEVKMYNYYNNRTLIILRNYFIKVQFVYDILCLKLSRVKSEIGSVEF